MSGGAGIAGDDGVAVPGSVLVDMLDRSGGIGDDPDVQEVIIVFRRPVGLDRRTGSRPFTEVFQGCEQGLGGINIQVIHNQGELRSVHDSVAASENQRGHG